MELGGAATVPRRPAPIRPAAPYHINFFVLRTYIGAGSAYGTRTRAPALRGPCPNRLDERASGVRMYRDDMQTQAWRLLTPERRTFEQELRGETEGF